MEVADHEARLLQYYNVQAQVRRQQDRQTILDLSLRQWWEKWARDMAFILSQPFNPQQPWKPQLRLIIEESLASIGLTLLVVGLILGWIALSS
jgi:hypothetical protein